MNLSEDNNKAMFNESSGVWLIWIEIAMSNIRKSYLNNENMISFELGIVKKTELRISCQPFYENYIFC